MDPVKTSVHRRYLIGQVVAVASVFLALAGVTFQGSRSGPPRQTVGWRPIHLTHRDQHWLDVVRAEVSDLTSSIQYTKRCISRSKSPHVGRKSITVVAEPLLQGTQRIESHASNDVLQPACVPLELGLGPPQPPVNASAFLFGISTTIPRLFDSIPQLARWLAHSQATLVVLVVGGSRSVLQAAEDQLSALGVKARLVAADEGHDEHKRHLAILRELYVTSTPGTTQWHVVIDDDTFFPYMPGLVDHMRRYDPNEFLYVGALSENQHSVDLYGEEAYGGAGIFVSAALAEKVHAHFDVCMAHGPAAGDVMIRDCIREHTETSLTMDDSFHQLDMMGDISGFYESGGMPLSLHHWKSPLLNVLPIVQMHLVSDYCGECFLQRWRFTDDFIVTNGFSAVYYPSGINFDTDAMELTFYQNNEPPIWRIPNLRPQVTDKVSYRLLTSAKLDDGSIRQIYFKRTDTSEAHDDDMDDSIIELHWTDLAHSQNGSPS